MRHRARESSVRRYHDRVAGTYDHSYDDAYWQWHDALTWDYLKPQLPRDAAARLLDLGCGTGKWAARLIKSGFHVTCVDISPAMLEQARGKIEQMGQAHRADFVQADLCDLHALPDATFALAVAFGEPIGCTDDPPRALREIRRTLIPAGLLVATFDNRLAAIDYYLERGDANELSRFLRDGVTHWLTREQAERFPIHTYTPAQLHKLAESAGFEVVDLVGKTVLPMRHYRALLEDPAARRRWAKVEKSLCRNPDAIPRAAHLHATLRVR